MSFARLKIERPVVRLLRIGLQGPAGPPGPQGPPGLNGSGSQTYEEYTVLLTGDQSVFVLPAIPLPGTVDLFVNGLRQSRSNFSLMVATVTVSGFTPTTDDEVTLTYQVEV